MTPLTPAEVIELRDCVVSGNTVVWMMRGKMTRILYIAEDHARLTEDFARVVEKRQECIAERDALRAQVATLTEELVLLRECEAVVRAIVHYDSMALSQHGECVPIIAALDAARKGEA